MGKKEPEITVEQAIKVIWDELYKAVKPIVDLIAKYDLPIPPPRPSITWNDGKGNLHKTFVDQMKPEDQEIIKDMMRPIGRISIGTPMKAPELTREQWDEISKMDIRFPGGRKA